MKIEFLEDGSDDCPLIRVYGTDPAEFSSFHGTAQHLAQMESGSSLLQELTGFRGVSGCTLTLLSGARDIGVSRIGTSLNFEWTLTSGKWLLVAGLIEPFLIMRREGAHQWLCGREARYGLDIGGIAILIVNSRSGIW